MRFSEMTKKTESLIELGYETEEEERETGKDAAAAMAVLQRAENALENAQAEADEDGFSCSNVTSAEAEVSRASAQYYAYASIHEAAVDKLNEVNREKSAHIRKLESYTEAEEKNLAQLQKLAGMAFSENASKTYQGMVSRIGEAQRSKAMLEEASGMTPTGYSGTAGGSIGSSENGYSNELSTSYSVDYSGGSGSSSHVLTGKGTSKGAGSDTAMGRLMQYMSDHNYGSQDYAVYSKDPVWQNLHSAVYPDENKKGVVNKTTESVEHREEKIQKVQVPDHSLTEYEKMNWLHSVLPDEDMSTIRRIVDEMYDYSLPDKDGGTYREVHNDKQCQRQDTKDMLKVFDSERVPIADGPIYRGVAFRSKGEMLRALGRDAGNWTEPGITSFSTDIKVAESFATDDAAVWGIVFKCPNNKTAIPFRHMSALWGESEVLSPGGARGVRWKINTHMSTVDLNYERKIIYIEIEEI